jgi:hypothetical protein
MSEAKLEIFPGDPDSVQQRQAYWDTQIALREQAKRKQRIDEGVHPGTWTGHTLAILPKLKHSRAYVLTEDSAATRAIAATLCAWQRSRAAQGKGFTREKALEFLQTKVAPYIAGLTQDWRPADEEPTPTPWKDESTGLPAQNPWITKDVTSQGLLMKRDPALANHLKELARLGGAPTYKMLIEQKEAKAAREELRALKYDADAHKENLFNDPNANLTQRSEFARSFPPAVAEVLKREATTPIVPPWHPDPNTGRPNLTRLSKAKADPELWPLLEDAIQIEAGWAADELEITQAIATEATRRKAEAERVLQAGRR